MKKPKASAINLIIPNRHLSLSTLLASITLLALIGIYVVARLQAATRVALEPEQGAVNATIQSDDSLASGGLYVIFKSVVIAPPPPPVTPPPPPPPAAPKLPSNVRIMTLGDSITEGATNGVAYRVGLNNMLSGISGHSYAFVGSSYDGQFNHEGHSGWCLNWTYCWGNLLPNIPSWMQSSQPNLVIMNGGVNDLVSGVSEPTVEQSMQQVINAIFVADPNVFIVVQPIAQAGGPTGDQVTYNNWMLSYVANRKAQGDRIYFANTSIVVNGMDGYHPVQEGYDQFAQIIFDVIRPLL